MELWGIWIVFFRVVGVGVRDFGCAATHIDGDEVADRLGHGRSNEAVDQADKFFGFDQFSIIEGSEGGDDALDGNRKAGIVLFGDVGGEDMDICSI